AIAHSQTGQTINFGEGAHQEQIRFFPGPDEREEIESVIEELDVGFVQNNQNMFGHVIDESPKLGGRRDGAGWIIRIGGKYHAGLRSNRLKHGREVMSVITRSNRDEVRLEKFCNQ